MEFRISGTSIIGSNLRKADLYKAKLIKANLIGSILIGARITKGELDVASINGADLRDLEIMPDSSGMKNPCIGQITLKLECAAWSRKNAPFGKCLTRLPGPGL